MVGGNYTLECWNVEFSTTNPLLISEHVWKFQRATLVNMVGGKEIENKSDGLLIVTVFDKRSGAEKNGTVCKVGFSWRSAHLFCRSLGHHFAMWGSSPRNIEYVPE